MSLELFNNLTFVNPYHIISKIHRFYARIRKERSVWNINRLRELPFPVATG